MESAFNPVREALTEVLEVLVDERLLGRSGMMVELRPAKIRWVKHFSPVVVVSKCLSRLNDDHTRLLSPSAHFDYYDTHTFPILCSENSI